jgi:lipid II:glycine glycyltransferase (peptidoglycan interpeptide bridge formation enzyme)
MAELMVAEYQRQTLASHLMIWCGQTATYLHGASADDNKNIMAPHLLQWRTIELAKRRGMEKYDWWGIHPDDPNHRWAGITRFKLGFGGEIIKYPGAINAVLQPQWYMAYRLAKRMRGGFDV